MPSEIITVAGTLVAALVAGLISYVAGRGMKTHEWRLSQAKEDLAGRKHLYVGFLAEAQRLVIQATQAKIHSVGELDTLSRHYAEITLVGTEPVAEAAKHVLDGVLMADEQSDPTEEHATDFHPRKQAFLNAARTELQSYRVG